MVRAGLLALLLTASGCFFEVYGGINPYTRTTLQVGSAPETEYVESCWSMGIALGFFLDAFGIGTGIAPGTMTPYNTNNADGQGNKVTNRSTLARLDVDLPTRWLSPWIIPRATLVGTLADTVESWVGGRSGFERPASGWGLFAGLTFALFNRQAALSIGPAYNEYRSEYAMSTGDVEISTMQSVGAQFRFMITGVPELSLLKSWTPSAIRPSVPVGEYREQSYDRQKNPTGCFANPHCY